MAAEINFRGAALEGLSVVVELQSGRR